MKLWVLGLSVVFINTAVRYRRRFPLVIK